LFNLFRGRIILASCFCVLNQHNELGITLYTGTSRQRKVSMESHKTLSECKTSKQNKEQLNLITSRRRFYAEPRDYHFKHCTQVIAILCYVHNCTCLCLHDSDKDASVCYITKIDTVIYYLFQDGQLLP